MRAAIMSKEQDPTTKVKICGLFRPEDIEYVNEAKPDFIGFVFAASKRQITPEQAKTLKQKLNPEIKAVGVFVDAPPEEPIRLISEGIIDFVQLHGNEDKAYIRELKEQCGCPVIRAVRVEHQEDIIRMQDTMADYLLLDQGSGGTGKTFNWNHVSEYDKEQNRGEKKEPGKKFFLAGGIASTNVKRAIERLHPFAIDVSSGVETGGVKDREKILELVAMVRNMAANDR